ncbi:MAG: lipopolysaccharide biosynthesis protein [Methylobacteriaceae bacterium]|nr:lipopolysaccharide biosynthesis protein [Methylobacteriaceae bacterium]
MRARSDRMLIYQTLLYLPAQFLAPLFQFVAAVVWTHWFLPEAYGVLAYVMAAQELAFMVCLSWWSHYTVRYLPMLDTPQAGARYLVAESRILVLTSLIQAFVGVVSLVAIGATLTSELVAATIFFTVSRSVMMHLAERSRSRGDVVAYSVAQIASSAGGFGLGFLVVAVTSATPAGALAGFAMAQIGALGWLAGRMGLRISIGMPDRGLLGAALRYGLPLVIGGAIGWVSINGIRVIVQHGAGSAAVGLVSVGWGLGQRMASFGAMLVTAAAFPIAVREFHARGRKQSLQQLSASGALLVGLVVPMSIGILLVARPLVDLLIAAPFRVVTLAVLPPAVFAGAIRNLRVHFADQVFMLVERTRILILVNAIEAIAVVGLCAAGLFLWGLAGAAVGCLAGIAVGAVVCFAVAMGRYGLQLPVWHIARIAGATGAMAIALSLPSWRAGIVGLTSEVATGIAVYGAALAVLYPAFVFRGCRLALAWG